ncbi:snaclec rhinocetin subunit beta [Sebastes umbrosus]|uniref:snaclec rhinocetin subunit beta n=1 Tax=Sebastes umbrosus TaxID=72105 RepID=UPI00189F8940|nr:snaclec rhinocetin subunit beta [Sebastes umbrosus]
MMMMTMKSSFSGPFVIVLLLNSTVCGLGSVVSKQYTYFHSHYSWQDAQNYCKSNYVADLATIYTQSDENLMTMTTYHAWIGLFKVTTSYTTSSNYSTYWKWSNGVYLYLNAWGNSEPQAGETCATVYYTHRRFYGTSCGGPFFFICHKQHPAHYEYKFIPQSKSRSEALQYCKSVYDDLATFRHSSDLISAVIERDFPVWTGLYREGGTWRWSTGLSEYRNWDLNEPGNNGDCVSISSKGKKMAT